MDRSPRSGDVVCGATSTTHMCAQTVQTQPMCVHTQHRHSPRVYSADPAMCVHTRTQLGFRKSAFLSHTHCTRSTDIRGLDLVGVKLPSVAVGRRTLGEALRGGERDASMWRSSALKTKPISPAKRFQSPSPGLPHPLHAPGLGGIRV